MKTQILEAGERSKNGKYIIDGWKLSEDMKNDWVLVRNVGWCRYVDGLCAFYVPNVGWITR